MRPLPGSAGGSSSWRRWAQFVGLLPTVPWVFLPIRAEERQYRLIARWAFRLSVALVVLPVAALLVPLVAMMNALSQAG